MSVYPHGATNAPEVDGPSEVRFRVTCTRGFLPMERVMVAVVPFGLVVPDDYLPGLADLFPLEAAGVEEIPCPFSGEVDGQWDGQGDLVGSCPVCGALVAAEAEAQV